MKKYILFLAFMRMVQFSYAMEPHFLKKEYARIDTASPQRKVQLKDGYILVYSKTIVKQLGKMVSLGDSGMAIGFWPFIFIRPDLKDKPVYGELVRHEIIHLRQQAELLIIFAWLLYVFEYGYARLILKVDKRQAYYYTALEQEAHRNAMNPEYLKTRKTFTVIKYIFNKKWLSRGTQGELIEKDFKKELLLKKHK